MTLGCAVSDPWQDGESADAIHQALSVSDQELRKIAVSEAYPLR